MPRYEYPDMSTSILHRNRNPSREELESYQLSRLNQLLKEVLRNNAFYRERYRTDSLQLDSLEALSELPLMCKSEPSLFSGGVLSKIPSDKRNSRTPNGHP